MVYHFSFHASHAISEQLLNNVKHHAACMVISIKIS